MCVIFVKPGEMVCCLLQALPVAGCKALTLVMLVPIQKDSTGGGGMTQVLNGPMDEVWGAVQPTCPLSVPV